MKQYIRDRVKRLILYVETKTYSIYEQKNKVEHCCSKAHFTFVFSCYHISFFSGDTICCAICSFLSSGAGKLGGAL